MQEVRSPAILSAFGKHERYVHCQRRFGHGETVGRWNVRSWSDDGAIKSGGRTQKGKGYEKLKMVMPNLEMLF